LVGDYLQDLSMIKPEMMVIGDINIDAVVTADEYPPEGGEAVVEKTDFRLGGSGCNTAVTLARLGTETWLVGNLGTDPLGKMAMNYICEAGIQPAPIQQKEKYQTGFFCIVVTGKGERTMFGGRGCNALSPDFNLAAKMVTNCVGLHLSGYTLKNNEQAETVTQLVKIAHQNGKIISLDPGVCTAANSKEKIRELLPFVDYLLISLPELMEYSQPNGQETGLAHLLESGLKAVVLKMGEKGSQYIDKRGRLSRGAFQHTLHPIQDTTGAGDAFNAGFLFATLHQLPIMDCLTLGNLCAFRSITSQHGTVDICQDADYLHSLLFLLKECTTESDVHKTLEHFLESRMGNSLEGLKSRSQD